MKKTKYLLLLICLGVGLTACKKNLGIENFDVEGQFKKDTTAIRAFAIANNIPIIKDSMYNIFYQIIAPGAGEKLNSLSTISVIYTGRLLDGTVFDSTTTPATFPLSNAITGWQAGIPLIRKGGKIRLLLPSFYGYGNQVYPKIPANSVLDFTVELSDVK
ncbi:FKBP-type peptidyl-prolyl cis-trans isomerase [Pedobacter sp. JCM 36344]|uniref:FKBP-type peptidyl-prolyl cis-trans isomerase n=1 Tax=Pedobacter sp. JCM 36344 TaxID=3374280 RepID=UPI00397AA8ED